MIWQYLLLVCFGFIMGWIAGHSIGYASGVDAGAMLQRALQDAKNGDEDK